MEDEGLSVEIFAANGKVRGKKRELTDGQDGSSSRYVLSSWCRDESRSEQEHLLGRELGGHVCCGPKKEDESARTIRPSTRKDATSERKKRSD